jgi:hypothetical protein
VTLAPPVSYTAVTGNFLTAALWNAQVRDASAFFAAPPAFRAYSTVTQSLTDNTWTSLNLDTEQFDNYGGHSTSTNTSRYTCQLAGIYLVTGVATFASNGTGNRAVRLAVNGTAYPGSFVKAPAPVTTASGGQITTALVSLAVGDYVEVMGNQNSGTALATSFSGPDVYPSLSVLWVSQ